MAVWADCRREGMGNSSEAQGGADRDFSQGTAVRKVPLSGHISFQVVTRH